MYVKRAFELVIHVHCWFKEVQEMREDFYGGQSEKNALKNNCLK
jgi:hypothetical protein